MLWTVYDLNRWLSDTRSGGKTGLKNTPSLLKLSLIYSTVQKPPLALLLLQGSSEHTCLFLILFSLDATRKHGEYVKSLKEHI